MFVVKDHTERILDQEIDTLQICPGSSNHVAIGTYSLTTTSHHTPPVIGDGQIDSDSSQQSRIGSIRVLPINHHDQTTCSNAKAPQRFRLDLPCAILNVRFCPTDESLIGVATSIGELQFFRLLGLSSNAVSDNKQLEIVPVGTATLAEQHEDDESTPPLITQFIWLQHFRHNGTSTESKNGSIHHLATCDTSGRTKLVEVIVPDIVTTSDREASMPDNQLLICRTRVIHKHLHDLEAWTIAAIDIPSESNMLRQVLLSGGDDSCLIASTYTLKLNSHLNITDKDTDEDIDEPQFDSDPIRIHLDKQTHTAGVVAIYPLPPATSTESNDTPTTTPIPILTGSYDQHLRLILLDPSTLKFTPISSLELEGGVWQITLIDTYTISDQGSKQLHHVLLVSAMYAGWYIVRLIKDLDAVEASAGWSWQIDVHRSKPHESMVYACASVEVSGKDDDGVKGGRWQVVTTSFYDKRICVWEVEDGVRARAGS